MARRSLSMPWSTAGHAFRARFPFQQRKDIVANFSALWKRMTRSFFWQEKDFLAANEINIDKKRLLFSQKR